MSVVDAPLSERSITIGTDYARAPGGRYASQGDFSGEHFRNTVLAPALRENDRVIVYLDGTAGYAGSFLEEAFGGLIRERLFTPAELRQRLRVKVKDDRYVIYRKQVEKYLADAETALRKL